MNLFSSFKYIIVWGIRCLVPAQFGDENTTLKASVSVYDSLELFISICDTYWETIPKVGKVKTQFFW